jgi:hypothetical protein
VNIVREEELSARLFLWNVDTLKCVLIIEDSSPTIRAPGGYTVARGTSQQNAATSANVGVFKARL